MSKATDFRYNTGNTRVPWAAVGENYNVNDLMEVIKFLMQGEGPEYDDAVSAVKEQIEKLDAVSVPPGKLSLASKVEAAEEASNNYLGIDSSTFVTNATAGFEIAYKYANLKPGDEVIVPAITFIATMAYPLSIGAKLVFADVDPVTINMDPADVARKITPKTKMISADIPLIWILLWNLQKNTTSLFSKMPHMRLVRCTKERRLELSAILQLSHSTRSRTLLPLVKEV